MSTSEAKLGSLADRQFLVVAVSRRPDRGTAEPIRALTSDPTKISTLAWSVRASTWCARSAMNNDTVNDAAEHRERPPEV